MNPKKILAILCIIPSYLLGTFYSPTVNYLDEHPIHEINYYQYITPSTSLLLNDIVEAETMHPVIGYHASTQKFRIFQDIIKGVVEEVLEYPVPEDFHFFRTPGMDKYDLPYGKQSFIEKFQRNPTTQGLDDMIKLFVLKPYNKEFSKAIKIKDLSDKDRTELRQFFIDFSKYLDTKIINFYGYEDHVVYGLSDDYQNLTSKKIISRKRQSNKQKS